MKIKTLCITLAMLTTICLLTATASPAASITTPTVTTNWATSVTLNSATLNGRVNPNTASTTYYFEYGLTSAYGSTTLDGSAGAGTSEVPVNSDISGLDRDTTYHYRIVANNIEGTSYGADRSFRTTIVYVEPYGSCGGNSPCYSTIQEAIDEAGSGGTIKIASESYDEDLTLSLYGNLILEGGWDTSFTTRSFAAGSNTNTAVTGTMTVTGDTDGVLLVENLVIDTEVIPGAPTVTTDSATSVTSSSATLNGTVNPNGSSTTYYFEYGTSTSYGSMTSSTIAGSGTSDVSASASVSGLSSNTTYHYRLAATHSGGTGYGSDETLNTGGSFTVVSSFTSPGPGPRGLAFDGTYLWNADSNMDKIYKLDTSGNIIDTFASPGPGPTGLAFDGTYLWNADSNMDKIYKLDTSGNIIDTFASPMPGPTGFAFDGTYLWSADSNVDKIYKLDTFGNIIDTFASPGPGPKGLAFDGTYLWNADSNMDKIYKIAIK